MKNENPNLRMCVCGHSEIDHDSETDNAGNLKFSYCAADGCKCLQFLSIDQVKGYRHDPRPCWRCDHTHGMSPHDIATLCSAVQEVSFNPDGSISRIVYQDKQKPVSATFYSGVTKDDIETFRAEVNRVDRMEIAIRELQNYIDFPDAPNNNKAECVCGHAKDLHFAGKDNCFAFTGLDDNGNKTECSCKHFDFAR